MRIYTNKIPAHASTGVKDSARAIANIDPLEPSFNDIFQHALLTYENSRVVSDRELELLAVGIANEGPKLSTWPRRLLTLLN